MKGDFPSFLGISIADFPLLTYYFHSHFPWQTVGFTVRFLLGMSRTASGTEGMWADLRGGAGTSQGMEDFCSRSIRFLVLEIVRPWAPICSNMLQLLCVPVKVETSIPRFRHRKPGTQHEASHQTSPNTIVRFSWHVVPVSGEGPWISYFHIFYVFLCVLFYVSVFLLIKLSFLSSCRPPLGVPFSTSRAGLRAGYGNLHEWSWAHTYGCQSACVSTNGPVHNSYVNKYVYIHILIYSNNSVYIYIYASLFLLVYLFVHVSVAVCV